MTDRKSCLIQSFCRVHTGWDDTAALRSTFIDQKVSSWPDSGLSMFYRGQGDLLSSPCSTMWTPLIRSWQEVWPHSPALPLVQKADFESKQGLRGLTLPRMTSYSILGNSWKLQRPPKNQTALWMPPRSGDAGSFHQKGRRDSLCEGTSAPVGILTGLSAEGLQGPDFCTASHGEASYFSNHPVVCQLEEEPGDSQWRNMYERVLFQNRCVALMKW